MVDWSSAAPPKPGPLPVCRIRSACESDDAFVAELARECGLVVDPVGSRTAERSRLLIAQWGELPAGFVSYLLLPGEMEIVDIAVVLALRKMHVGKQLMTEALAQGRRAQAKWAFLEVRRSNRAAQTLYRSVGFQQLDVRPKYYAGSEDALLLRARL